MPHKINPIDFENGEGNLGVANALLEFFSRKLPVSRLQRDLSDSTVMRNLGVAFGHSLFAYRRLLNGLGKLGVDRRRMLDELRANPAVLAEAVQTILRREGYPEPYEVLKGLTRGRALTLDRSARLRRHAGGIRRGQGRAARPDARGVYWAGGRAGADDRSSEDDVTR